MTDCDLLVTNATTCLPSGVSSGSWIAIREGRISACGVSEKTPSAKSSVDAKGLFVSSGLVDIHCHGGNGGAIVAGNSPETKDGVRNAVRFHNEKGSTRVYISAVSMSEADTLLAIHDIRSLIDSCEGLEGLHLEGPFLNPNKAGAHELSSLRLPMREEVLSLISAADELPVRITLAPELDGGIEAVSNFSAGGWKVSVGHTEASSEQTKLAIQAGASDLTHAFNAMNGVKGREPGPVGAAVSDPSVFVELIADGQHLSAEVLRFLFAAIPERVVLVSDSIAAAGQPDGSGNLGGLKISISEGVARTSEGSLAGSTKSLSWAVRYLIKTCGIDPFLAISAASQNPARAISRQNDFGSLTIGAAADLVLWDDDFVPSRVWRAGVEITSEVA